MNLQTAKAALTAYLSQDVPAFMWGAPGIGKSDIVREIAAETRAALIDLRAILLDPVDLRGLPAITDGRAQWLPPAFLPDADRDGPTGILFLDELNAAPASVQAACFQLVLDRKVGEYRLPAGWRIIAAGNRQSDRAAAQRMPSALANRFAHIDVEACPDTFCDYAISKGQPTLAAFIKFRPALLHAMDADARAFPTPRAWMQAAKFCDQPKATRMPLIAGLVGEAAAGEFEGFIRAYESLPALSEIIADPEGAKAPNDNEPAQSYAIAAALSRAMTRDNIGPITTYLGRLPREYEIMSVSEAVKRDPSLTATREFNRFAIANAKAVA